MLYVWFIFVWIVGIKRNLNIWQRYFLKIDNKEIYNIIFGKIVSYR